MPERFEHFQRLPAELRLMIWEFSLPEPRVYEVLDAPNAKQKTPPSQGLMFANVHAEPPPALSAVCSESRVFVLKQYRPLTLGRTTKFVDLSRDILLLEPYLLVKRLHRTLHFMSQIPLVREALSRLALGTSYGLYTGICHPVLSWRVAKNNMGKLLAALSKFPRLKTLVLVVHQEFQFEFDFRFPVGGLASPYPHPNLHRQSTHRPLLAPPTTHQMTHTHTHPSYGIPMRTHMIPTLSGAFTSRENELRIPGSAPFPRTHPPPIPLPTPRSTGSPQPSTPHPSDSVPPMPSYMQMHTHMYPNLHTQPHHLPYSLPQLVHQAYRFKFDIEANINHMPRRPHFNELMYYPLEIDEDKDENWDLNDPMGAGPGEEEWCDPWPTNDDWRRFRRRFQRAVNVALEMNAQTMADGGGSAGNSPVSGRRGADLSDSRKCIGNGFSGLGTGLGKEGKGLRKLRAPELKGASLLWRYPRGT